MGKAASRTYALRRCFRLSPHTPFTAHTLWGTATPHAPCVPSVSPDPIDTELEVKRSTGAIALPSNAMRTSVNTIYWLSEHRLVRMPALSQCMDTLDAVMPVSHLLLQMSKEAEERSLYLLTSSLLTLNRNGPLFSAQISDQVGYTAPA